MSRLPEGWGQKLAKEAILHRSAAKEVGKASLVLRYCDPENLVWDNQIASESYFKDEVPLPDIVKSGKYHYTYHRPGMSKVKVEPETMEWPLGGTPSFRELSQMEEVFPDGPGDVGQEWYYTWRTYPDNAFIISRVRYGQEDYEGVGWNLDDPEGIRDLEGLMGKEEFGMTIRGRLGW